MRPVAEVAEEAVLFFLVRDHVCVNNEVTEALFRLLQLQIRQLAQLIIPKLLQLKLPQVIIKVC